MNRLLAPLFILALSGCGKAPSFPQVQSGVRIALVATDAALVKAIEESPKDPRFPPLVEKIEAASAILESTEATLQQICDSLSVIDITARAVDCNTCLLLVKEAAKQCPK